MKKAAVFSLAALSSLILIKAQTPGAAPAAPNPVSPSQPAPPSTDRQLTPPRFPNRGLFEGVGSNQTVKPFASTNQSSVNNATFQDRAVTTADRLLLIRVRQTVETTLQITASPSMPVHFDINNGVVTLLGTVETANQKLQVVSSVQQTPGVARVIDQLGVDGSGQVSTIQDQALLLRVRQTVMPQIQVGGVPPPIDFNVQQGLVTITGSVPNLGQKRQLLALVQQVPGVVQVSDQTMVNASGAANPNLTPTGRPSTPQPQ